jgi:hypothetical protein
MPELPLRIQEKIQMYTSILTNRYPPNIPSWKISTGYASFRDAQSDTTPVETIYSLDDSQPTTGSKVFSDSSKTTVYDGSSLWFHLFNSSGTSLSTVIQINNKGDVINRSTF